MKFSFHFYRNRKNQNMPRKPAHTTWIYKCILISIFFFSIFSFARRFTFKISKMYFWPFWFYLIERHELFPFVLLLRLRKTFITRCSIFIILAFCPLQLLLLAHSFFFVLLSRWLISYSSSIFSVSFYFDLCVYSHCGQFADNSNSFQNVRIIILDFWRFINNSRGGIRLRLLIENEHSETINYR